MGHAQVKAAVKTGFIYICNVSTDHVRMVTHTVQCSIELSHFSFQHHVATSPPPPGEKKAIGMFKCFFCTIFILLTIFLGAID
jgi:hypothetical protein